MSKKKEKKAVNYDEDLDAIFADLNIKIDNDPEKPAENVKNKKGKKGKVNENNTNQEVTKSLDDLQTIEHQVWQSNETDIKNNTDAPVDDVGPAYEDEKVSGKALKNRLKKERKKQAAKNDSTSPKALEPQPAKGKTGASAAARLALEQLRIRREAEQAELEEELRLKREEEERIRLIEEQKIRIELEKERKRIARLAKREKDRKEGKLLTAKGRENRVKAEAFKQQLIAQGLLDPNSLAQSQGADGEPGPRKNKVIDSKKKKIKKPSQTDLGDEPRSDQRVEIPKSSENSLLESGGPVVESAVADWDVLTDSEPNCIINTVNPNSTSESKALQKKKSVPASGPSETLVKKKVDEEKATPTKDETSDIHPDLRSPICCILGHVDTGKTKILDKIRKTNIQENEAGGITQQIGATFCPSERLYAYCKEVEGCPTMQVPGLLIIDTPGHESFNNLRSRGSSLCDIAVLVIDIMHGLEPQTKESIGLLRARKCPFVVALNKIDRIYGWVPCYWKPIATVLASQTQTAREEFFTRANKIIDELRAEGLNSELYWLNKEVKKVVSIVPTSAINGEGVPDLMMLLIKLTQDIMTRDIKVVHTSLLCTILEVKSIEGLGVTIDVILVNGTLSENDTLVVCGMNGPIVTTIRALLTPQPMREMRVKGEYTHHKSIRASMGVKISAQGLDDAVVGTAVLRADRDSDLEVLKEEVMVDMSDVFRSIDKSGVGLYVMASTLGSLEALLCFLKDHKIRVFAVNIGTVHKSDVKKASIMREKGHPEFAVILCFDVKIDPEADNEAKKLGVRIFQADIIYHLFDGFTKYLEEFRQEKKKEKMNEAVFPCILKVLPEFVFNKKDPIVMGVTVEAGCLQIGTPLVVPEKDGLKLGRVSSLEHNKKSVQKATTGMDIAIKITGDPSITYGRHFDHTNKIFSKLTRESIDCLKEYFRDELSSEDWRLVVHLKKVFGIV